MPANGPMSARWLEYGYSSSSSVIKASENYETAGALRMEVSKFKGVSGFHSGGSSSTFREKLFGETPAGLGVVSRSLWGRREATASPQAPQEVLRLQPERELTDSRNTLPERLCGLWVVMRLSTGDGLWELCERQKGLAEGPVGRSVLSIKGSHAEEEVGGAHWGPWEPMESSFCRGAARGWRVRGGALSRRLGARERWGNGCPGAGCSMGRLWGGGNSSHTSPLGIPWLFFSLGTVLRGLQGQKMRTTHSRCFVGISSGCRGLFLHLSGAGEPASCWHGAWASIWNFAWPHQ